MFVILAVFISLTSQAQRRIKPMDPEKAEKEAAANEYQNKSWSDRMVYGGNFMISFGSNSSQVLLAPLVGFKVNDHFMVGSGVTYMYWSQNYYLRGSSGTIKISDNIYGLNFFGRHSLFGPLFVHGEYQPMNFTAYNGYGDHKRIWTNALFLGGGVSQQIGDNGAFYLMLLYDVLWQNYPSNPWSYQKSFLPSAFDIRMGFFF